MGSLVEQTHGSRASWKINKLSVSCWWYEVRLCPMGLRGALRQCSWPRIVCPIHQWPATTAYLQTEIVWRWHHLSVPHLHSWRSSNTPKLSKQFLYGWWEGRWNMCFHLDRCDILSVTKSKRKHYHALHGQMLKSVNSTHFLGVTL